MKGRGVCAPHPFTWCGRRVRQPGCSDTPVAQRPQLSPSRCRWWERSVASSSPARSSRTCADHAPGVRERSGAPVLQTACLWTAGEPEGPGCSRVVRTAECDRVFVVLVHASVADPVRAHPRRTIRSPHEVRRDAHEARCGRSRPAPGSCSALRQQCGHVLVSSRRCPPASAGCCRHTGGRTRRSREDARRLGVVAVRADRPDADHRAPDEQPGRGHRLDCPAGKESTRGPIMSGSCRPGGRDRVRCGRGGSGRWDDHLLRSVICWARSSAGGPSKPLIERPRPSRVLQLTFARGSPDPDDPARLCCAPPRSCGATIDVRSPRRSA